MGLKCQFKETDDGDDDDDERGEGERECVMTVSFLKSAASCSAAAAAGDCLASTHPAADDDDDDDDVASFVTAIISPPPLPPPSLPLSYQRAQSCYQRGPPSLNDGAGRVIHSRAGCRHGRTAAALTAMLSLMRSLFAKNLP